MSVLSAAQRKLLSDTVAEARDVVEAACAQRIAALGVGTDRAPEALNEEERRLRGGLRARARQLGSIKVLGSEAAYEHWHRMLFTRYLADNNLLVDDHTGQSVTIDEVADYAAELGEPDMWEVAARFGAAMLPGIFRQDDPLLQMRLPVETTQRLEGLLNSLPRDVIVADDSLGWVYQYWQARRKEEVNRSERKIGGADLAPVTQLFTDDYMVRFLLENSLGAWWAARHPDSSLLASWEYLRFADGGSPAAGTFDAWPESAAELTVMDPCCGSGHFLVAAFGMLWRMRAEEEGLDTATAQDSVLRDNLFGLELDPRCTQIATFALALNAWTTGGYRPLPLPNIACSGIPVKTRIEEWKSLARGEERIEKALIRLHLLFRDADTLGSLIDLKQAIRIRDSTNLQSTLDEVDWDEIAPILIRALNRELDDPAAAVLGAAAAGAARAADYLSGQYTLVATNPPWLKRGNQSELLKNYCESHFGIGQAELATSFFLRLQSLAAPKCSVALVSPQGWLTAGSYREFRKKSLSESRFSLVARLGPNAFEGIGGEIVQPVLTITSSDTPSGTYCAITADELPNSSAKSAALLNRALQRHSQFDDLRKPDSRITLSSPTAGTGRALLSSYAAGLVGMQTSDDPRYKFLFWEIQCWGDVWERLQDVPTSNDTYSGCNGIVRWEKGAGTLATVSVAWKGRNAWGRSGVIVARFGNFYASLYLGGKFHQNAAVVLPEDPTDLEAILVFCQSPEFESAVREIDRAPKVTNATLVKVSFDMDQWRVAAAEKYHDGLPNPYSNDPTQWLFRGDPARSTHPLQVAVARLLGYRWPGQEPDDLDELADRDGVVSVPPIGGELPASERLLQLLARAYGKWSPAVLDRLLADVGAKPGAAGLAAWLRNGFFKDHSKLFSNRPFIWQIWDGVPDGFSALVNYHRLDRRLLERLAYDYLGNWWLGRVRDDVVNEVPGAETRLAAAEQLKTKLQLILEGEPPYDTYVRWKSLAEQPLGWDPDLDDGVRLNIRPFVTAGVLRSQPKINWNMDRGRNPDGSDRINDLHFTLAQKRAARGRSG
ncbi:Eco57I restriction-modification methylase domain-containing protein [Mycolicibacterium austroafricanum]|uniref:Eco57I restriction-modification methylase domain-containing protein n=1 Tax=Mycolicibacterium austroafricanum TaxID=39687 RepID=UPI001CA33EBC|nr:DNA methyltransferase [Mycolicibacterium austroafricanum]QZT60281.1 hypothetical protein JN085_14460 [Mycolicibacterium austroafricanum]